MVIYGTLASANCECAQEAMVNVQVIYVRAALHVNSWTYGDETTIKTIVRWVVSQLRIFWVTALWLVPQQLRGEPLVYLGKLVSVTFIWGLWWIHAHMYIYIYTYMYIHI